VTAIAHPSDAAPDDETPHVQDVEPGGPSVSRLGFGLIVRFVRLHPLPFAISILGGVGWAAIVVAASYVLGRITDEVITPGFSPSGR